MGGGLATGSGTLALLPRVRAEDGGRPVEATLEPQTTPQNFSQRVPGLAAI